MAALLIDRLSGHPGIELKDAGIVNDPAVAQDIGNAGCSGAVRNFNDIVLVRAVHAGDIPDNQRAGGRAAAAARTSSVISSLKPQPRRFLVSLFLRLLIVCVSFLILPRVGAEV